MVSCGVALAAALAGRGGDAAARHFGSARVAAWQVGTGGACCLLAPWLPDASDLLLGAWLVLWNIMAAGDSAQFSALTAASAPMQAVGSGHTFSRCDSLVFCEEVQWMTPAQTFGKWCPRRYIVVPMTLRP
jgi:hypothetical protein